MRTWSLALSFCFAACSSSNDKLPDGAADLASPNGVTPDLAGAEVHPDLASVGDGGTCTISTSPSGYECDPWSVHFYGGRFVSASATTLRYQLWHDPANEGLPSDVTWPAAHDYRQTLTVDFPIDDALRHFVCIVFAPSTPPSSYPVDATLLDLTSGNFSLTVTPMGTYRWQNVSDLCGVAALPVVMAPQLVSQPSLPEVAVMIPLLPDARLLTVGAQVSGWLARGMLGSDEDRELVPVIHGTVVEVMTHPCQDRANGICD